MSRWRQPWVRVEFADVRGKLQILDPETAFTLEPQIIRALGDDLALACAAPDVLRDKIMRRAVELSGGSEHGDKRVAFLEGARMVGAFVSGLDILGGLDHRWLSDAFEGMVLGRLKVRGELIETFGDWQALGLHPLAKWVALAGQVKATFRPLWLRSPYRLRAQPDKDGVPEPKSVPLAVRWADALAAQGRASSAVEILREWTPVEMIQVVESAAYQATRERVARERARGGG